MPDAPLGEHDTGTLVRTFLIADVRGITSFTAALACLRDRYPLQEAAVRDTHGRTLTRTGQLERARQQLEQASALYERLGAGPLRRRVLSELEKIEPCPAGIGESGDYR